MNIPYESVEAAARLDEITARLNAATPGPWSSMTEETPDGENIYFTVSKRGAKEYDQLVELADSGAQGRRDAEFIAHAPEDIAYLLGELKNLGAPSESSTFACHGVLAPVVELVPQDIPDALLEVRRHTK